MALPATDAFTGTDGTALTTYSANWTNNVGSLKIQSNSCVSGASGDTAAHWNADVFGNDQYAQATVVAIASGNYIGVCVRAAAAANTWYGFTGDSADASYFFKYVAGTYTEFASAAPFAVNDVVRIEAQGTAIRAKINGVIAASTTDSAIASGSAGVAGASNNASSRIDNWEGGNITAATKAPPLIRRPFHIWRRTR